ncbi:Piezo-type mechanosensitive ion channel component 2 [Bagarius yarrelli]|uniref:Piezo-type mechanosensitive ion channel component 2 n=1 Tax=Bagarius yarrelli TaxID=175774 RepID=A0A556VCH7_BAGYA|nr:Piezo-type mechanosensitive ion channel component 2 [Bagarius yarrelli]
MDCLSRDYMHNLCCIDYRAIALRYNGLSVVYLLFLLFLPLLPSPSPSSMKGKTGQFLLGVCSTAVIFLVLQCGIQITFAYVPKEMSGPLDNVLYHLGIVRFSDVDAANIIRLLVPDLVLFLASMIIRNLCNNLLRPATDIQEQESIERSETEEASETSESEYEEESEASSTESSEQNKAPPGPPQVQKLIVFAAGLRLLLSTVMNTAGKVVVTILMGLAVLYYMLVALLQKWALTATEMIYSFSFWMLLRQQLIEKQEEEKLKEESPHEVKSTSIADKTESSSMVNRIGEFIKGILVKYWIVCCCLMFFVISFSGKVVVYKILYICLFLFCMVLYQVQYDVWRQILKYFWAVVVGYSMMVLILIYMYQFKTVSGLFRQIIGMSEEGLRDLGLEQFDTVELFAQILLPATFLLACILQLHYFNCDFLTLTDLKNVPVCDYTSTEEKLRETLNVMSDMIKENIEKIQNRLVKEQLNIDGDDLLGSLELNSLSVMDEEEKTEEEEGVSDEFFIPGIMDVRYPIRKTAANGLHRIICLGLCDDCISFVVAVNVIGQRMDFYALLHSFALIAVLARRRRKAIGEVWPQYCCFTASLMVFQYLLCIGLPPAFCVDYPWRKGSKALSSNQIKWLYLPDYAMQPNPMFIFYDFLLLIVASLQWQVFEDENKASVRLVAGDNVEISRKPRFSLS